jgi:hypothetical protein
MVISRRSLKRDAGECDRERRGGRREPLWTQKEGRQLACELRDDGDVGVEVQVYREGELLCGRRWATRALALAKADEQKAQYLSEGGVLIAERG